MKRFQKYFGKFKKKKTSDIKVVVLCVIAATTFWVLNALNKDNYVTVVNYPIVFQYNAEEYMPVEEIPSEIRIEINGNGWDLFRKYFNFNVPPFNIELTNPDERNYLLASEYRRNLAEVLEPTSLVSVLTDSLKFNFDKIVERQVEVGLDTGAMSLAPHHQLAGDIAWEPKDIVLKGAESKIKQLGGELFLTLNEEHIKDDFDQYIPVPLTEALSPYVSVSPKTIHVKFSVVAFLEGNKRVMLRKVNFPENVRLDNEINSVLMSYRVDERKVEVLRELDLVGVLDYRNRNIEDSTVTVEINDLPDYIKNIDTEPHTFNLSYE
ncbi:YbbR-like domain-containing protein [Echinicola strongylocentroti]|uniref:YbbR-like domain-containing protein n=1 Tax=Echinicola strongylocentroti TaxID=1795355 RepID=A0A2Z4IL45_9BACT|nr:YbbR-like domain-containing protein [Echinicola strongylocentroti]AWW31288.1 YbbR-like domain-containing protein [Echinicola strongylocentroti]